MRIDRALLRAGQVLYAVSLVLPAVFSTGLSASRATYGIEIVLAFPIVIVNPLAAFTHPLMWAYVSALWAGNLIVLLSPRLHRLVLQGVHPAVLAKVLSVGVLAGASVAVGVPGLLGVPIEHLSIGFYCWLLSLVLTIAGLSIS